MFPLAAERRSLSEAGGTSLENSAFCLSGQSAKKEVTMKYKIRETVDLIIRASAGLLSKESNQSLMMFVAQFVNRENISEIEEPIEIKKKILREYRVSLNGVTRNLIYFEPYRMGKNVYIIDVNNPKHIFTEQANQLLGG